MPGHISSVLIADTTSTIEQLPPISERGREAQAVSAQVSSHVVPKHWAFQAGWFPPTVDSKQSHGGPGAQRVA